MRWSVIEIRERPWDSGGPGQLALVVSNEAFNKTSGYLTVLPAVQERHGRTCRTFEVLLPAGSAGNPENLIVMPHRICTVPAEAVVQMRGRLNDPDLRLEVVKKLLLHLGIEDIEAVREER